MHLKALISLVTAIKASAPDVRLIVFGSSSAFGSFPDLADEVAMYEATVDADIVPEPLSGDVYLDLTEKVGKTSPFFDQHGYYTDVNGPRAFDYMPTGFRDRLVPLPGVENVFALEPNDMAVAKVIAGRPKDIQLLSILLAKGYLDEATNRRQLWFMEMDDKLIVRCDQVLKAIVAAARELGYTRQCPEQPWKTLSPQS